MRHFVRELSSFSQKERLFILFAILCGFCISCEYAISRPVSNATFLSAYGSSFLPWAWIAAVPLNFAIVALYNRYLPRLGCAKMFLLSSLTIISVQLFCSLFLSSVYSLPFCFYVWKEIYILLMFQQLWSVIHMTISFDRAKYLYGFFFAIGAFGAFFGSLLPGFFAVKMGSESLLIATLPLYLLLIGCYSQVLKHGKLEGVFSTEKPKPSWIEGFRLISSSKLLLVILSIVACMQFASTLIDFQFNASLELKVGDKDLRTQYMGQIMSVIHLCTMGLQIFGSFLCIKFLGVKRSHMTIPVLLLMNAALFQCFPWFSVVTFSFICVKSFDFSLFTILKELLYIPLSAQEKFQAKAVIDVFAHRSSKAIASLLILALQQAFGTLFLPFLGGFSIALFIFWMILIAVWLKEPAPSKPVVVQS